jgi:hypothetical protein
MFSGRKGFIPKRGGGGGKKSDKNVVENWTSQAGKLKIWSR